MFFPWWHRRNTTAVTVRRNLSNGRWYNVHVPINAPANAPVILMLHGGGAQPGQAENDSGLSGAADKHGFIAVYPAGTGSQSTDKHLYWNTGRALKQGVTLGDDIAYFHELMNDLKSVHSYNPKKVFASGISNGAQMCFRLMAEFPVAAIAPVAGRMLPSEVSMPASIKLPMIWFQGLKDTFAPINGGGHTGAASPFVDYSLPSFGDAVRAWAQRNGCVFPSTVSILPNNSEESVFEGTAPIITYILGDGGHSFPGGKLTLYESTVLHCGPVSQVLNAIETMWAFFADKSL